MIVQSFKIVGCYYCWQLLELNAFLIDQPLQKLLIIVFFVGWLYHINCKTFVTKSACPCCPMLELFKFLRKVKINNNIELRNIDSSSEKVSSNNN